MKIKLPMIVLCAAIGISVPMAWAAKTPPAPAPAVTPAKPQAALPEPKLTKEQSDFFEGKVRPVLAANCYRCHSAAEGKVKGGLVLDTREGMLKGGDHGVAIVPGNAEESLIYKRITGQVKPAMPLAPVAALTNEEIAAVRDWINAGAPIQWPNGRNQ